MEKECLKAMKFFESLQKVVSRSVKQISAVIQDTIVTPFEEFFGDSPNVEKSNVSQKDDTTKSTQEIESSIFSSYQMKLVAGLFYCNNKKEKWRIWTFENNDIDREVFLLETLEAELGGRCSDMRENHGYSQDDVSHEDIDTQSIYPLVTVEREF